MTWDEVLPGDCLLSSRGIARYVVVALEGRRFHALDLEDGRVVVATRGGDLVHWGVVRGGEELLSPR